jgi:hypothetical protein
MPVFIGVVGGSLGPDPLKLERRMEQWLISPRASTRKASHLDGYGPRGTHTEQLAETLEMVGCRFPQRARSLHVASR